MENTHKNFSKKNELFQKMGTFSSPNLVNNRKKKSRLRFFWGGALVFPIFKAKKKQKKKKKSKKEEKNRKKEEKNRKKASENSFSFLTNFYWRRVAVFPFPLSLVDIVKKNQNIYMERSNERVTSASSLSRSRNIFSSEPHLLKGKNFSTTSFSQLSSSPNNTSRGKSPSSSSRRTSFRRETSRTSVQLSPKKRMGSTSPILSNPRKGDLSPPLKFLDHRSLSPPPKFLDERPNFPPPITKEPPISPERRPRETPFRGTLVPRIGALSPERPMSEREFLLDSGSVSPTWVSTKDSLWQETKSKPREGLFLQERRAMSPPMKGSLVGGGERKKPFILDNNNNNSLSFPCLPIGEPLSPENNFLDRQAKMMGMTPVYSPPREIFTTGSLIEETTFEEPKTSTNIKKLKFKDVLQDPILLPKFKAFLSDEMADENFLFYQELEIYRNLDNEEERLKKSKQIHQTFFSDSSSHAFFCTAAEKQSMEELKGTTRMFEVIEGRVIMELSNLFRRFVSSGKLASALPSSSSPLSSPTLGKGGERYPPLVSPPSPPPPRLFRKSKTSLKPKRPNSLLTITFSKKKREKQSTVDVEGGRMSVWNEGQNELLGLRIMATNFYRKVDSYFSSFSPGLNDNCKVLFLYFLYFLSFAFSWPWTNHSTMLSYFFFFLGISRRIHRIFTPNYLPEQINPKPSPIFLCFTVPEKNALNDKIFNNNYRLT